MIIWLCDFLQGVGPCFRLQTKLHISCGKVSYNLRQPYNAGLILLRSYARLSQDGNADLQDTPGVAAHQSGELHR